MASRSYSGSAADRRARSQAEEKKLVRSILRQTGHLAPGDRRPPHQGAPAPRRPRMVAAAPASRQSQAVRRPRGQGAYYEENPEDEEESYDEEEDEEENPDYAESLEDGYYRNIPRQPAKKSYPHERDEQQDDVDDGQAEADEEEAVDEYDDGDVEPVGPRDY